MCCFGRDLKDDLHDDSESDGEQLGDTLETALKLNRAYQELLRIHMGTIKTLLDKNSAKQVGSVQGINSTILFTYYIQ